MTDIDFIEWRMVNNTLRPVGVMEITRVDVGKEVDQHYLGEIINRYEKRDMQARTVVYIAKSLRTNVYIVLFRENLTEFWVYNLSKKIGVDVFPS